MTSHHHLVIMAGGIGSRFWPLSSEERPKQFLDILGCGRTMLQLTAERFSGIVPAENTWVVTSERYADIVQAQLPDIPTDNILLEPCMRGTAPCICYVSWKIKKRDPRASIVVSPSDYNVKDSFKEKPTRETAQLYLKQADYFWNSGIFVWGVATIVNAFRVYAPQISRIFEDLLPHYDTPDEQCLIRERFPQCENISVDYAIMEKAEDVFVRPSDFGWNDLGTWSSLHAELPHDAYGNAIVGDNVSLFDTHNSIIHVGSQRRVVIQGIEDSIVVEKDNALLICKISEEQRIGFFQKQ